jgi:hypothetical protein
VSEFEQLPPAAAWRHKEAREGFEVAFFAPTANGWRMTGRTSAVEDGIAWSVSYAIDVDESWLTRRAAIDVMTADGTRHIELTGDGDGNWHLGGQPVPHVAGCLDVDLESSSMTNTLPVHRLPPGSGTATDAPAVYVRATDLAVERLEQTYRREPDAGVGSTFDYAAPRFDTRCHLVYDAAGLITVYPGIAERVF